MKTADVLYFNFVCSRITEQNLHGGAGEGLHHALRQRARGRCFSHHLVLWSGHWSQYAHYR